MRKQSNGDDVLDAPADCIDGNGGMPTVEEFRASSKILYDADEFYVERIQHRVLALLNKEDGTATDITYETAGALLIELANVRYILELMLARVTMLEKCRDDLGEVVRAGGRLEIVAQFDEYGHPRYGVAAWRRGIGEVLGVQTFGIDES